MAWAGQGLQKQIIIILRFAFAFAFSLLMRVEICWGWMMKTKWSRRCAHEGEDVPMKGKICPWKDSLSLSPAPSIHVPVVGRHGKHSKALSARTRHIEVQCQLQSCPPQGKNIGNFANYGLSFYRDHMRPEGQPKWIERTYRAMEKEDIDNEKYFVDTIVGYIGPR